MSKGGGGGANYYPMPTIQASNSATSSSTNIPQWLTDASQFGVQNAQNIVKQGTPQYNGPLAVGMAGDQVAAGNLIRNSVGAYQPYYDAASGAINNSMTRLQPQTLANGLSGISQYMNPYIDNVVNSVNDISRQNLDRSLTQTADQALAAKAFGGSRHGVQEGVATAQNNLNTNNLIANLLSSGYNQATNMLGTDVQAQNQAAQQNNANALAGGQALSNLGTANRAANTADINNLLTYGGIEQQTGQNAADKLYNYFQYQNEYPLKAQQVYNQTVSTAPHSTSSTGSSSTNSVGWAPQQQATSNPLMGGLGGALAGAQLGSIFPGIGTGLGAVGGGLLGLLR
jgi:hypothetical protein